MRDRNRENQTMNPRNRYSPRVSSDRGFTLLEIVMVIATIALLAAVAIPIYANYMARSEATDFVLKFDAIRSQMQVYAKTGEVQNECLKLSASVPVANLQPKVGRMGVDFEPVAGGFTPVLTICAAKDLQGQHAVEVVREAHGILGKNTQIGQGAVIGEAVASFTVKLAGDRALCKTLPQGTVTTRCKPIDAATLGREYYNHNALDRLWDYQKEDVMAIAIHMALDPAYATAVNSVLASSHQGWASSFPRSLNPADGGINLVTDQRDALIGILPMVKERICHERFGLTATCS